MTSAAAARELLEQHRSGRRLTPLPLECAPVDVASAYRVQDEYLRLLETEAAAHVAGWKIALTTPVMQSFVGIPHPLAGAILAASIRQSPARLSSGDWVHLGLEAEIAVRLGADLADRGAPYHRESVAASVVACMAALEIVDDRHCEYRALDPHLLIADNAFNAGCVIGPEQRDWRSLDLQAARGSMRINGEVVGAGVGGDVLGHPLEALAWLANHLIDRGRWLRAGDVVLTGSIVTTQWPAVGDAIAAEVEGLGRAACELR